MLKELGNLKNRLKAPVNKGGKDKARGLFPCFKKDNI